MSFSRVNSSGGRPCTKLHWTSWSLIGPPLSIVYLSRCINTVRGSYDLDVERWQQWMGKSSGRIGPMVDGVMYHNCKALKARLNEGA